MQIAGSLAQALTHHVPGPRVPGWWEDALITEKRNGSYPKCALQEVTWHRGTSDQRTPVSL